MLENLKKALLKAFDEGDRDSFYAVWNMRAFLIGPKNSNDALQKKKLEFYLQIYFATYPINPLRVGINGAYQEELNTFKHYIENSGGDLSQTSEFVTYYALPYVPNPTEHKSFKHLFTKDYVSQLKQRLQNYLELNMNVIFFK